MDRERFVAMTVVLAVRCGYLADDTVELLCLKRGDSFRYRIFLSTTDIDCRERLDDLDAVEFDSINANEVETFLIESLWRLHLSPIELQLACSSFEWATVEDNELRATAVGGSSQSSHLLSVIERQLAVFRSSSLEPLMLTLIDKIAADIGQVPYLSEFDRTRLSALRHRASVELSITE